MSFAAAAVPILSITNHVGAADIEYTFRVPFPCQVTHLIQAADAADGTDKFITTLQQGATILATGTSIESADVATVDVVDQVYLGTGIDYKVFLNFSGTAANVKGITVTVWAVPHR